MDERIQKYDEKMTKTLNNLESEYASIRAGRANRSEERRVGKECKA